MSSSSFFRVYSHTISKFPIEWRKEFIDYMRLIKHIKKILAEQRDNLSSPSPSSSSATSPSLPNLKSFSLFLSVFLTENDRVHYFLSKKSKDLAKDLEELGLESLSQSRAYRQGGLSVQSSFIMDSSSSASVPMGEGGGRMGTGTGTGTTDPPPQGQLLFPTDQKMKEEDVHSTDPSPLLPLPTEEKKERKKLLKSHSSSGASSFSSAFSSFAGSFSSSPSSSSSSLLFPETIPRAAALTFASVFLSSHPSLASSVLPSSLLSSMSSSSSSLSPSFDPSLMSSFQKFLSLCVELDWLRRYVINNFLALKKILMKYEINTGDSCETFLKHMGNEAFYTDKKLNVLLQRCEHITQRFIHSLERTEGIKEGEEGEREGEIQCKVEEGTTEKQRCPLCTRSLHNPIALSCSHLVCLFCLSNQLDTSSFFCPLCHKAQDIDSLEIAKGRDVLQLFTKVQISERDLLPSVSPSPSPSPTQPQPPSHAPIDLGLDSEEEDSDYYLKGKEEEEGEYKQQRSEDIDPYAIPSPSSFPRRVISNRQMPSSPSPSIAPTLTIAMSPSPQPKVSGKSSCHQCNKSKDWNVFLFCHQNMYLSALESLNSHVLQTTGAPLADYEQKKGRRCRKKYCAACLKKVYNVEMEYMREEEKSQWRCMACQGICVCKACKRSMSSKTMGMGMEKGREGDLSSFKYSSNPNVAIRAQAAARKHALPTSVLVHPQHMHPSQDMLHYEQPSFFFSSSSSPPSPGGHSFATGTTDDVSPLLTPYTSRPASPAAVSMGARGIVCEETMSPHRLMPSPGRGSTVSSRPRLKVSNPLQSSAPPPSASVPFPSSSLSSLEAHYHHLQQELSHLSSQSQQLMMQQLSSASPTLSSLIVLSQQNILIKQQQIQHLQHQLETEQSHSSVASHVSPSPSPSLSHGPLSPPSQSPLINLNELDFSAIQQVDFNLIDWSSGSPELLQSLAQHIKELQQQYASSSSAQHIEPLPSPSPSPSPSALPSQQSPTRRSRLSRKESFLLEEGSLFSPSSTSLPLASHDLPPVQDLSDYESHSLLPSSSLSLYPSMEEVLNGHTAHIGHLKSLHTFRSSEDSLSELLEQGSGGDRSLSSQQEEFNM